MMNRCLDERNPIQPHWFIYYVRNEIVGRELVVASFLDPSAKSGMANDFKAIVTVGLDRAEMLFNTLHAWIRHATINEMWEALWRIHAEYGGSVGVEENMFGEFLTESYQAFATRKGKFLPLTLVHHVTDKEGRMLGTLAPLLEFGRVRFEKGHSDQDLLVEQSRNYKVTGLVRNDGEQTYAVSAIHVTFYDASGFRGVFQKAPGRGRTGGEWIWHGRTEADFGCLLLAPGEACPFSVEITAQDMASFLIHPDAVATHRQSAPVSLSDVVVREDGTDYLRITGTATNASLFKVKQVTVSGVLLDRSDQIVSVGWTYVLGEGIEPGESVPFDLRVEKEPYTSYQLYAQAERDWD